jgi:hypothetical protein
MGHTGPESKRAGAFGALLFNVHPKLACALFFQQSPDGVEPISRREMARAVAIL